MTTVTALKLYTPRREKYYIAVLHSPLGTTQWLRKHCHTATSAIQYGKQVVADAAAAEIDVDEHLLAKNLADVAASN